VLEIRYTVLQQMCYMSATTVSAAAKLSQTQSQTELDIQYEKTRNFLLYYFSFNKFIFLSIFGFRWERYLLPISPMGSGWLSKGRWVAKLVARLLATATLWVRIQTSLKNTKWAT